MNIYRTNGTLLTDIPVDDDSFVFRSLMGDEYAELHFELNEYTDIPVGCYVMFENVKYILYVPANITKHHNKRIQYTLRMETEGARANSVIVRNPIDGRVSFSLTATPREHIQLIVDNLNRRDSGWAVGTIDSSTEKVVTYDYTSCMDGVKAIADAFNTEYEIVGKTISLHRVEYHKDSPLVMAYGKGNGFLSGVARTNEESTPPPDFIFPQGSDRNISIASYGAARLHLPSNAVIGYDGVKFSDQNGYNSAKGKTYVTDSNGTYVAKDNDSRASYAEYGLDCTEIYPSRVGQVSDISEVVQGDNIFYDIIDENIPDSLDYSADGVQIEGTTMMIVFQTGMLAGREIEVARYVHSEKRFELAPMEIDGTIMPSGDYLPVVGDDYIVINVNLPQAYINSGSTHEGAEWQMLRKCVAYLHDHRDQRYTFTGDVDSIWLRNEWADVGEYMAIGQHVQFEDYQFLPNGIILRISDIKQYVNNKYKVELTLTNTKRKSDFMTRWDAIRRELALYDAYDPQGYNRVNSQSIAIRRTLFGNSRLTQGSGNVVSRISTLETSSTSTQQRVGNIETKNTTNYGKLGTYTSEASNAFGLVRKIVEYNCDKIAQGTYQGYEQAYEKNGQIVNVTDLQLQPIAPKL